MFKVDFESGLIRALRNVYPNVTISGCWYHFMSVSTVTRNMDRIRITDIKKRLPNILEEQSAIIYYTFGQKNSNSTGS